MQVRMTQRSSPSFAVGGVNYDPVTETFWPPPWGWSCFHCNAHFTNPVQARWHFGARPTAKPKCFEEQ